MNEDYIEGLVDEMEGPETNGMVCNEEWKFIYKIMMDNTLFLESRVSYKYFDDTLAQVVFMIMGQQIGTLGEFHPLLHLKPLLEDERRMEAYKEYGYPLELNEPMDIVAYAESFKDDEVGFKVLEDYIITKYQKSAIEELANEILDRVEDSDTSIKELTHNMSARLDNLLYEGTSDAVAKSTSEVVDDMELYINSDEVDEYTKTGVSIIDQMSGGTTTPAIISWVANAKVGKSALLIDSLVSGLENGRTVAFYSIEMNIKEVMLRIYSRFSGVPFTKIGKKTYDDSEKTILIEAIQFFKDQYADKFFIYSNPNGISTKIIESHIARLKKSGINIQDIYVDYLQLLESSSRPHALKVEQMMELPKDCRVLAQKMNIRMFLPAQLHSSARVKKIEDINGDDVHYVKGLEKECHVLLALHKEDDHHKIKYIVSRFEHDDETYYFPNVDLNRMYFGDVEPWDETLAPKAEPRKGSKIKPSWDNGLANGENSWD